MNVPEVLVTICLVTIKWDQNILTTEFKNIITGIINSKIMDIAIYSYLEEKKNIHKNNMYIML